MSKNGIEGRYSIKFIFENSGGKNIGSGNLITGIPDAETAHGIEQIIIDRHGGAMSKNPDTQLTNRVNSTNNQEWIEKGRKWLDENFKDWKEKIPSSKSTTE